MFVGQNGGLSRRVQLAGIPRNGVQGIRIGVVQLAPQTKCARISSPQAEAKGEGKSAGRNAPYFPDSWTSGGADSRHPLSGFFCPISACSHRVTHEYVESPPSLF